jgi:LysM repeat protein
MIKTISIFLLISVISISKAFSSQSDSVNVEITENLVYILHKVEVGQTLYSLTNKYNCGISEVSVLNPSLKSGSAIKIGQTLKFPMIKNGKQVSALEYKRAKVKSEILPNKLIKYHDIKAGETIFSIAKKYDLDISNLVEANNISDNNIKIGSKLLIEKDEIDRLISINEKKKAPALVLNTTGHKIQETGVAEVINTANRTSKYLAMHRTAAIGSNIKITNEANGITIVAKVVGNLSKVGPDENIMLKLSPFAYYKLRPNDTTLRATVEFYL